MKDWTFFWQPTKNRIIIGQPHETDLNLVKILIAPGSNLKEGDNAYFDYLSRYNIFKSYDEMIEKTKSDIFTLLFEKIYE